MTSSVRTFETENILQFLHYKFPLVTKLTELNSVRVYTSLVKPLVSMLLLVVVIDNVNMLGQESLGGVSYTVNRLSKEKNLSVYESFLLLTKVAIICTGWNSSLEAIFYYNRVDLKGLSFKFPTTIILYELLNLVVVIDNVKMLG
ncbi:hypothetical protein V6N13_147015 [Hibiscus sabdariffa]